MGATMIAYGVSGPQHHPRGLQRHLDQHTVGDRQGVRQAGSAGRSPLHQPDPRVPTVMTASKHDNVSTPDELLGIGPREAQDRRLAVLAQQRWESEGGALRRRAMTAVTALLAATLRRCGVLSDDELRALREIERRLRWESPELFSCSTVRSRSPRRITVSGRKTECCWPQPRSPDWSN